MLCTALPSISSEAAMLRARYSSDALDRFRLALASSKHSFCPTKTKPNPEQNRRPSDALCCLPISDPLTLINNNRRDVLSY